MAEIYSSTSGSKKMSQNQRKRFIKKLLASYEHADVIKEKLEKQKERETTIADNDLASRLDTLSS